MGQGLFSPFRNNMLLNGHVQSLLTDAEIMLLDLSQAGSLYQISSSTNATPIVITTSAAHGLAVGDRVVIQDHLVNTNANGTWQVLATPSSTTFSIEDENGVDAVGNGVGGATGTWFDLELSHLDEIPVAARVTAASDLVAESGIDGVFDANDITFSSVTAGSTVDAFLIFMGNAGGSGVEDLVSIHGSDTVTNFPITTNGGDITIQFDSGVAKIFRITQHSDSSF